MIASYISQGQREKNIGKEFDGVQKVWRGTAVEEKKEQESNRSEGVELEGAR